MQILFLVILGLVQGLTEFLPVSSSGHLVLLSNWFGISDSLFVSIILHFATLFAVVVCLRKEIWQIIKHPFGDLAIKIYLATIPTCIIVLILMPLIGEVFNGKGLAFCFIISAIILICADLFSKKKISRGPITCKRALFMGVMQGFAVLPGVSRSGTTTAAGIISGADKEEVAKFSFLMSIPIILMSLMLEIYKIFVQGQAVQVDTIGIILAALVSFVVGVVSIKFMIKITAKYSFKWFAVYLLILAILTALI